MPECETVAARCSGCGLEVRSIYVAYVVEDIHEGPHLSSAIRSDTAPAHPLPIFSAPKICPSQTRTAAAMAAKYQPSAFLNIPVSDMATSTAYYSALGFVENPALKSAEGIGMSLPPSASSSPASSDIHLGPFKIMLLTRPFFQSFLPKGVEIAEAPKMAQMILCISRESRESVDVAVEKASQVGGERDVREKTEIELKMEEAGMYGRVLRDPDGHLVEVVFMPTPEGCGERTPVVAE
jgi:uncharacterized protein